MANYANNDYLTQLPGGAIIMWSGTLADLNKLKNWVICDGTNKTPDLRNQFVVGAGKKYMVGDHGGHNDIKLTVNNLPAHRHDIKTNSTRLMSPKTFVAQKSSGIGTAESMYFNKGDDTTYKLENCISIKSVGNNAPFDNRPPYFALYYIMKIKSNDNE
ncbi:hypothetical protein [Kordia sp.]|uniref:hypothetical protein n=1 Tax=Kordia sp. TaxID=1965332 RepID=UPI003B5A150A